MFASLFLFLGLLTVKLVDDRNKKQEGKRGRGRRRREIAVEGNWRERDSFVDKRKRRVNLRSTVGYDGSTIRFL